MIPNSTDWSKHFKENPECLTCKLDPEIAHIKKSQMEREKRSVVELPATVTIKGKPGQFWRSAEEVGKMAIVESASVAKNEGVQLTTIALGVTLALSLGFTSCYKTEKCKTILQYGNYMTQPERSKLIEGTCR